MIQIINVYLKVEQNSIHKYSLFVNSELPMYQSIIKKHDQISLEEETHTYKLLNSDIEFNSVTEFINTFFNPFDEKKIAQKLSGTGKYQNLSVEEILKDWENRRNRGTIVHKQIEEFLKCKEILTSKLDTKSKQAIMFLERKCMNKNNILFPEVKICSEKLKLAGTIDLMIYNKNHNRIYLIDWKTNSEIKKKGYNKGICFPTNSIDDCSFNRYKLQLSIYQYILEEFYNASIDGLYILHLKDESHKIMKCDFEKSFVLNMVKSREF